MFLAAQENILEGKKSEKISFFVTCLLASFLIGLFGKVRIFLPFTPIPIVLQKQVVLLLAFLLGPKKAAYATLFFIIQAAIGLPVLPSLFFFTIAKGYYIGYLLAAVAVGALYDKNKGLLHAFIVSILGNFIIYLSGFAIYALYTDMKTAFLLGVVPFIIPGMLKNLMIVTFLKINTIFKR